MHTTHLLTPRRPFDFAHTLAFTCGFTPMADEQTTAGGRLRKAHEIGGRVVVIDVEPANRRELAVTLHTPAALSPADVEAALDRVRFTLGLDDDLAPFYARAAHDPSFARVVAGQYGHHHVKFPSPFEITVWAVLAQRTPMLLARATKRAIVERVGLALEVDGERHPAFPTAARLAALGESDLRAIVENPVKAAAIGVIAEAFQGIDEAWLRNGPFADVRDWLARLPRIGTWSTQFVLYRGLGRMERLELTDGPIVDAARKVYGPDADVPAIAASYGEHVGSWCLYLRTAGAGIGARSRRHAA